MFMTQSADIRELVQRWMVWKSRVDGAEYQYKMLAAAAGVSPSYLSNIMTGARNAGVKTITGIARAFEADLAGFYAGPPENGVQPPAGNRPEHSATATASGEQDKYGLALSREPDQEIDKLFSSLGYSAADLFTDMPPESPGKDTGIRAGIPAAIEMEESIPAIPGIPLLDRLPEGGQDTWIDAHGDTAVSIPRDFGLGGRRVFAVRMPDASMAPDLRQGDILIADIDAPFEPGEGIIGIVMLDGRFIPRKIIARTDDFLALPSNPGFLSGTVSRDARIFRIVLWLPSMDGKF